MDRILIVEDDNSLRESLALVLEAKGFRVSSVATAEEACETIISEQFECLVVDFRLPGMSGIELIEKVRELPSSPAILIMTAYGSINLAVDAMKRGASDFVTKPFEPEAIAPLIRDLIKKRTLFNRITSPNPNRERAFLANSEEMQEVMTYARKVARVDTSVMILGESGTGKELLARYIHQQSPRAEQPFFAINCAALAEPLLESELFGHEAGSFTGATRQRTGLLEQATRGTVFLDEVAEMSQAMQVKLLRAIQEREIQRVGGGKSIKINPRFICATNRNLEKCIEEKNFREDLYYRLAVVTINIPPLRQRPHDIDLLSEYFVRYFCERIGKNTLEIDASARALLRRHIWPGNARELENVLEAATLVADQTITPQHLQINANKDEELLPLFTVSESAQRQAEHEHIRRTLQRTAGNKVKAAKMLGVSYKTLLSKIKELGIG